MVLPEQTADNSHSKYPDPAQGLDVSVHTNGTRPKTNDHTTVEEEDDDDSNTGSPVVIRQSGGKTDSPLLDLSRVVPLEGGVESCTTSTISLQKDHFVDLDNMSEPQHPLDMAAASSVLVDNTDRFIQLELTIKKTRAHTGLGITIVASQKPIPGLHQIRRIMPGGVAARDNRLKPGDRLVSVNGVPLLNLKSSEVQQALSEAPKDCLLTIYRDLDFEFDASSSVTSLGSVSARSSIVSSEDESYSPTKRFSDSYDLSSSHVSAVALRGINTKPGVSHQHHNKRWSTGILREPSPLLNMATHHNPHNLLFELNTYGDHSVPHLSTTSRLESSLSHNAEDLVPTFAVHDTVGGGQDKNQIAGWEKDQTTKGRDKDQTTGEQEKDQTSTGGGQEKDQTSTEGGWEKDQAIPKLPVSTPEGENATQTPPLSASISGISHSIGKSRREGSRLEGI